MEINKTTIDINTAIEYADYNNLLFKHRDNGMFLNDFQVDVLKRNGLDYRKYPSVQALLFDIEEILNSDYDDELDIVSGQLAELVYYRDTKKWETNLIF